MADRACVIRANARPALEACLKSLRDGDTLIVWRLDRLGRSLADLIRLTQELQGRGVGFASLTAVIGTEAALAIPAYQNISKACKAPALEESGRINTCRKIADVMRSGDTYITEMMGVSIAKRVWPEESAEYSGAVAAWRLARYRMDTEGSITLTSLRTNAEALEYGGDCPFVPFGAVCCE